MSTPQRPRLTRLALALALLCLVAAACGDDTSTGTTDKDTTATAAKDDAPFTLRLGYFPNVTHAPALVGVFDGFFAQRLGKNVTIETHTYNAGPEAVEAIFAGALDVAYVGPNPAINAFQKSKGEAVRIISGAASGGAFFVVKPEINSAADLKGKTVADPKLGGTQDVALRSWLATKNLKTDTSGGGDVSIAPSENADTLTAFKAGTIAGAWVPEPWATRLVQEGGGKVLVDEADLWPGGKYPTTLILATTKFINAHPAAVEHLLEANLDAIDKIASDPTGSQAAVNTEIESVTGKKLSDSLITAAWKNLTFTADPVPSALTKAAKDAKAAGLLEDTNLKGIFDLGPLNKVLKAAGKPAVKDS